VWAAAEPLAVSEEDRSVLERWVRAHNTPRSLVDRCLVILRAADGESNRSIAQQLSLSRPTVMLWRQRFETGGSKALTEIAKGRGRKHSIPADKVKAIVEATLHTKPPAATHWSTRSMAKAHGVSHATVQRIWDDHSLQPHRVEHFKLSRDRKFVEKLTDVVGLYMDPPDKAIVLCIDEKSQIQALDRTQPGLPLKKGRCATMTHDYKRNGTTTLFAALSLLDGKVIGQCLARHRHQEFLKFLRHLDREMPKGLKLHLIVDNYGTHKHPVVTRWLESRQCRFELHFIPTSSSWLNMVERWFRNLTNQRIRRGAFAGVPDLIAAIEEYLQVTNKDLHVFVWTASAEAILEKIARCKAIYETLH
jgi:transposase